CVAVRRKNGEISTEQMPLPRISEQYKIFKYPVFRGVGTLYHAMSLGMKALKFSADIALEDETHEQEKKEAAAAAGNGTPVARPKPAPVKKAQKEVPGWAMAINIVISLGMFIVLNKLVPLSVATWLQKMYPDTFASRAMFNLADGVVRMLI